MTYGVLLPLLVLLAPWGARRVAYSAISGAMGRLRAAHKIGILSGQGIDVQRPPHRRRIGGDWRGLFRGDEESVRLGGNAVVEASLERRRLQDYSEYLTTSPGIQAHVEAGNQISSGSQRQNHRCHTPGRLDLFCFTSGSEEMGTAPGAADVAVLQTGGMPQALVHQEKRADSRGGDLSADQFTSSKAGFPRARGFLRFYSL